MAFNEEHAAETYRSFITVSVEGLKAWLLINGGAVVALLVYLSQSPQGKCIAPHAWVPLGCFIAGVAFSGLAFGGSYATQLALYNEDVHSATYKGPKHTTYLCITVILVALSFAGFVGGAISSVAVLAYNGCP